jgi:hypothetical protein
VFGLQDTLTTMLWKSEFTPEPVSSNALLGLRTEKLLSAFSAVMEKSPQAAQAPLFRQADVRRFLSPGFTSRGMRSQVPDAARALGGR